MAVSSKSKEQEKYGLNGVPPFGESFILGLQHIFAMFLGNIAVPILVAGAAGVTGHDLTVLVQSAMVMAGIATIIQCYPVWKAGAGLPIVMGTSFGFLPTNLSIVQAYGMPGLLGATFAGGVFGGLLGFFLKPLKRFFPKIVTGTVVLTIGLSLLPTGISSMAGGNGAADFGSVKNWGIALFVMGIVVMLNRFAKGMLKTSAILIAILIGYVVSLPLGMVEFSAVQEASWLSIPRPLYFPIEFHYQAIFPMMIMFLVTSVETVGDVTAITIGGMNREPKMEELSGAVISNGITSAIGALFNSLPNTSFSQNVGMITLTKIMSRFVVATGAVVLLIAGLVPKFGALIATLPQAVIGGASIVIFSQITLTGIGILTEEPLNEREKVIVGLSLVFGIGLSQVPEALQVVPSNVLLLFGESGIVVACLVAIALNILIPEKES